MAGNRFGNAGSTEIQKKRENIHAKTTQKANMKAARALRDYLRSRNEPEQFENLSNGELNQLLSHFYVNARKMNGEKYKMSSLENLRFSLNRHMQGVRNYNIDIIKDPDFRDCNVTFRAAMQELKREGKGSIEHHPEISEAHLKQIYNSHIFQPNTPVHLLNKVQFDIRFYFTRRGGENMPSMTKSTFAIKTDPSTGREYVYKKLDELNKNNREGNKKPTSGIMPAKPGSPACPVLTFKLYLSKLSDRCEKLWQRPRDSFFEGDTTWYCAVPLGEKTLSGFMSRICTSLKLPIKYTNHCIRATGATLLSRANFNNAQIMAVTGHKSVSSLAVYQRVSDDEKIAMGNTLAKSLDPTTKSAVRVPGTNNSSHISSPASLAGNGIDLSFEPMNLEEFDSFLGPNSRILHRNPLQQLPLFANCVISNLTINYNR